MQPSPTTEPQSSLEMPRELSPRRLLKRGSVVAGVLAVAVLVVVLAPGLSQVRDAIGEASAGWIVLAVVLEFLSGVSYVIMFKPVFCDQVSWRTSWEMGWAELGVGSILPASGAGGLALGAWLLHEQGMAADRIARRSVAFFLLKSAVNFVAVALLGTAMAVGLIGPHQSLWLTAFPAAGAALAIAAVIAVPRVGLGSDPAPDASRLRRGISATRRALIGGVGEAVAIVRARDMGVIAGSIGYWAFDNAVLWATYHAVGSVPPLTVVLMGYLIGQLGGLLPLPGGLGGIDGGLIGTLVVFGAPLAPTVAAVLIYRVAQFWVPLLIGAVSFVSLRRGLNRPERRDLCTPPRLAG